MAFLKGVAPSLAVISSGPYEYGTNKIVLPDQAVLDAFAALGIQVERTDANDKALKQANGPACPGAADRVGMDDAAAGGCDNFVVEIKP